MARKIYRTKNKVISYSIGLVLKNGKKHYVYFTGGVTHPKFIPSTYETEDTEVQAALEKAVNFNKKFELATTIKEKKAAPAKDAKEVLKPFGNTSISTAITSLVKQGWEGEVESLVDIESVQAAGKSVGITFPNLK